MRAPDPVMGPTRKVYLTNPDHLFLQDRDAQLRLIVEPQNEVVSIWTTELHPTASSFFSCPFFLSFLYALAF